MSYILPLTSSSGFCRFPLGLGRVFIQLCNKFLIQVVISSVWGEAERGVFAYECRGRRSEVKGSKVEINTLFTEIYSNCKQNFIGL